MTVFRLGILCSPNKIKRLTLRVLFRIVTYFFGYSNFVRPFYKEQLQLYTNLERLSPERWQQ
jgi:hypothetical protein